MEYKKIKPYTLSEVELREIWSIEYCREDIITFDEVHVRCYEDMFDHIFYESAKRKEKDKSILFYNRLEKIYWIKDALRDPDAILKIGWNNKLKEYYKNRRVAVVKGNYVVVIRFVEYRKAKLVTAYEKDDISNILESKDFDFKNNKFTKKENR